MDQNTLEVIDPDERAAKYNYLAGKIANKYAKRIGYSYYEDLRAEAWIGILKASRSYKEDRGKLELHLTVVATRLVIRYIWRYIFTNGFTRISNQIRFRKMNPPVCGEISLNYAQKDSSSIEIPPMFWEKVRVVLSGKILYVMEEHYQHGKSLTEIATNMGVTRAYTYLLRKKGLELLRTRYQRWCENLE